MPATIGATPETLHQLSGEIQQGAAQIENLLEIIANKVRPLTVDWRGAASESFEELWAQWQSGAEHINQALMAISELLAKAGDAYAETDRSISQAFQL